LPYLCLKCAEKQAIHGYLMIKILREKFHIYVGPSTIYPMLKVLENLGMLSSHWKISGERPTRVYEITELGLETLSGFDLLMNNALQFSGEVPQKPERVRQRLSNVINVQ